MYLDETILQSNTTNSLINFIKDLYLISGDSWSIDCKEKYNEITKLHSKAMKKRSMKYRKSELEA